jgi:hypothetical protein
VAYDLAKKAAQTPLTTFTTPTAADLHTFLAQTSSGRASVLQQFQALPPCVRASVVQQVCYTPPSFNVFRSADATPPVEPSSSSSGLSDTARNALIGVLVPVGVILLMLGGLILIGRRAQRREEAARLTTPSAGTREQIYIDDGDEYNGEEEKEYLQDVTNEAGDVIGARDRDGKVYPDAAQQAGVSHGFLDTDGFTQPGTKEDKQSEAAAENVKAGARRAARADYPTSGRFADSDMFAHPSTTRSTNRFGGDYLGSDATQRPAGDTNQPLPALRRSHEARVHNRFDDSEPTPTDPALVEAWRQNPNVGGFMSNLE